MKSLLCENISIDFLSQKIEIGDKLVKLDPKAFKTLRYLVEKRHRVVTSDELIKVVWDDRGISNDVVISAIGRIRKLFKDAKIDHETIHTVHKVGYQFTLDNLVINTDKIGRKKTTQKPNRIQFNLNWVLGSVILLLVGVIFSNDYFGIPKPSNAQEQNHTDAGSIKFGNTDQPTEIFFLRHADKRSDEDENPHLSELGIYRSKYWQGFFQHIQFDEVYTTEYHRNIETATLVLGNDSKKFILYSPMSFDIVKLLDKIQGKKVLIIGHSNTIPDMVNRLVGHSQYEPMSHKNYNYIYQVYIGTNGNISSNLFYVAFTEKLDSK